MPQERACSLARSDVICYDNLTRVADAAAWAFNGGPNNNGTYTGATGWQALLKAYAGTRSDKLRFEWSYSISNLVALGAAVPSAKRLGGCINGLVNNVQALSSFGARTLYGSRYAHIGGPNSLADVSDPAERARLLGDDPNADSYSDNMRGIGNWPTGVKVMLHDDGACMWASHTAGGSFRSTTWAGFSGHGLSQDYGAYLRTLYADDAAYAAARTAGTVPSYFPEARQWLLESVTAWHGIAANRAHTQGMEYVANIAGVVPNKHPQTAYAAVASAIDYGMCELAWQNYTREGSAARFVSDRAVAENLSDATTLRRMFASMALSAITMRGSGRRATFAVYPLIEWIPPKSGGASSPPVSTSYTVPTKVERHQRISWAWLQALGCPSIIPAYIYDEAMDTAEYGYTGYTGNNKPSFYMPPANAVGWFEWVAQRGNELDDFDLAATVAIVQPLDADFWRGAVDGASNHQYNWTVNYLLPLIEAQVPFVILPVDSSIGYPLSGYDLTKYRAVITASNNTLALPGGLSDLAPVTVSGASDSTRPVFCVPRIDRARNRLALHVVNTHSCDYAASSGAGGPGTTQTTITLALKPWAMLTRTIKAARWYSHESTTQGSPVRLRTDDKGAVLTLPAFLEGGVVVLDFA